MITRSALAQDMLAFLAPLRRSLALLFHACPPADELEEDDAPLVHPELAAWATRHGFVRDASARRWIGRTAGFVTLVEPGTDEGSPLQILVEVPLVVAGAVTLTATTLPRDDIERLVGRLFDVDGIAASLVSVTLLRGAVHLVLVPGAPIVAVEMALGLLAYLVKRDPRTAGSARGALQ